jgi:signal transduction histidine kinase
MTMTQSSVNIRTDNHARTIGQIWLVSCLLLVATWFHVENLVTDGRVQEMAGAQRDLSNITRLTQEHTNRTLRSADQVIRFVQSRYLELGDRLNLSELTQKGVIDSEIFNQVGVIDAKGIYILANLPTTGKLDLSDREHFKVHVAADTGELFISKPVLGRASGKWSIQLTRRITRPNGEFAGVVVVSIDPGYFTRFYKELNLGPQGLAALYGLDGIARARKVGDKEEFGTNAANAKLFELMGQGTLAGSYIQRSVVDGIERMYHFRKVPQYQLAVSVGLDMKDLTATQTQAARALRQQGGVVTLLIIALAASLTRHLSQIRRNSRLRQATDLVIQDRTEQLNAILALSPDGFVTFDREHRVKYVSPAFTRMTAMADATLNGLDEQDFCARFSERCNAGSDLLDITDLRTKVAGGKADATQTLDITGDGKRVLKIGLRLSDSGSVAQVLYFRDVTHETEVDNMKSDFLSTAAHELRTPMASIFGFSEVLLHQQVDSDAQREFLGIIFKQSKLMAKILDELLDLARIESRRGKDFRYSQVCLQDLAEDLAHSFIPPEGRSALELVLPQQKVHVLADSGKLRQAVLNVVSNAYKYSPGGGPVVLEVDTSNQADPTHRICIHISDQGIGMTPEQRERVCERFYRADTSGKTSGTGLGMSIVKEIIDLHGGDLSIHSGPGTGTRVSMCLPD